MIRIGQPRTVRTTGPVQKNDAAAAPVTDIEDLHREAILRQQSTYIDPPTGFKVFTELVHLKRGTCCGNRCRHCPFGWSNVRRGSDQTEEKRAVAKSGDRKGTRRLVKRILDGTYYENDDSDDGETCYENDDSDDGETCSDTSTDDELNNEDDTNAEGNTEDDTAASKPPSEVAKGGGGRAGGSLTSKNVPYTRSGDKGTAQLFTGERRKKDDDLFEAMGTVDELCSVAGVAYAQLIAAREKSGEAIESVDGEGNDAYGDLPEQLLDVMSRLFDVGSHIGIPASPGESRGESTKNGRDGPYYARHAELLELWIDAMTDRMPELASFILPTGSPASAQLHAARTVCRRAERRMVPLVRDEGTVYPEALAYVNRLSDYFFTAARFVDYCDGRDEVQYRSGDAGARRERVVVKLKK